MSQLSYSIEHAAAVAGGLADTDLSHRIIGMRNNLAVDLPYGLGVVFDTGTGVSDRSAKLPTAATDVVLGVTAYSQFHAPGPIDSFGVNGIRPNDMFNMLSRGSIYVKTEQDVDPTSDVYCRFAPGTVGGASAIDQSGGFRKDYDRHTAWAIKTAYALAARVTNDTGKVYECTTAGTSADSPGTGPAGTTAGQTDGTAVWKYVGATVKASTFDSAFKVSGARWASKTSAGGIAVLELNLPA